MITNTTTMNNNNNNNNNNTMTEPNQAAQSIHRVIISNVNHHGVNEERNNTISFRQFVPSFTTTQQHQTLSKDDITTDDTTLSIQQFKRSNPDHYKNVKYNEQNETILLLEEIYDKNNKGNGNNKKKGTSFDVDIEQDLDEDGIIIKPKWKHRKNGLIKNIDPARITAMQVKELIEKHSTNLFGIKLAVEHQCITFDDADDDGTDTELDDDLSLKEQGINLGSTLYLHDKDKSEAAVQFKMSYDYQPGDETIQCKLDHAVKLSDDDKNNDIDNCHQKTTTNINKQNPKVCDIHMELALGLKHLADESSPKQLKLLIQKLYVKVNEQNIEEIWDTFLQKITVTVNIGQDGKKEWRHCETELNLNQKEEKMELTNGNECETHYAYGGGLGGGTFGGKATACRGRKDSQKSKVKMQDSFFHIEGEAWRDRKSNNSLILIRKFWNREEGLKTYSEYKNEPKPKKKPRQQSSWFKKIIAKKKKKFVHPDCKADKELYLEDAKDGIATMIFRQPGNDWKKGGEENFLLNSDDDFSTNSNTLLSCTVTVRMELVTIMAKPISSSSSSRKPDYYMKPTVRHIVASGLHDLPYTMPSIQEESTNRDDENKSRKSIEKNGFDTFFGLLLHVLCKSCGM